MAQPVDFIGLNTFIYEINGYDADPAIADLSGLAVRETTSDGTNLAMQQNSLGVLPQGSQTISNLSKNDTFPLSLPGATNQEKTASMFTALMLRRNGPYGYSSWQQLRVGQNPLTRRQNRNNIFTHVVEPGPEVSFTIGDKNIVSRARYGEIRKYVETPVVSKFKPLRLVGEVSSKDGVTNKVALDFTMGNDVAFFDNKELNDYFETKYDNNVLYETITDMYLDGELSSDASPFDRFHALRYKETIYPSSDNMFLSKVRSRLDFTFPWHSDRTSSIRDLRNVTAFGTSSIPSQSAWPLDADRDWTTKAPGTLRVGKSVAQMTGANGILQNPFSRFEGNVSDPLTSGVADLISAPSYHRRHTNRKPTSVVSPTGMDIPETGSLTDLDGTSNSGLYEGTAKWQAGEMAGYFSGSTWVSSPKVPFYDSYESFAQNIRMKAKDHSVIPEYRMSSHVETNATTAELNDNLDIFELTGASISNSGETNFFEVYSNSDFLRHFTVIKEDHKDLAKPTNIKLICKAIKKFLPYEGFYPCQRTVQVAQRFHDSYSSHITPMGNSVYNDDWERSLDVFSPLFNPGILFNTIKSGVAIDYPIATTKFQHPYRLELDFTSGGPDQYFYQIASGSIDDSPFSYRVPFEALVSPNLRLAGQQPSTTEVDRSGIYDITTLFTHGDVSSGSFWDGSGDDLYIKMVNNFIGEIPKFFLKNEQLSSLYSLPQGDPNFGLIDAKNVNVWHGMRIKMYSTISGSRENLTSYKFGVSSVPIVTGSATSPQNSPSAKENFTMYSRPSAFGPDNYIADSSDADRRFTTASAFTGYIGPNNLPEITWRHSTAFGRNWPYTPPYYYGEAWMDVYWYPEVIGRYTLPQILSEISTSFFYRYWNTQEDTLGGGTFDSNFSERDTYVRSRAVNAHAMQLTASLNTKNVGKLKEISPNPDDPEQRLSMLVTTNMDDPESRWIIQTKFETPTLNFNYVSATSSSTNPVPLELPNYASESVPRGMWHQYGRIPDPDKGIFIAVEDIPLDWQQQQHVMLNTSIHNSGQLPKLNSLADVVGFAPTPKRIGELADRKRISEAIVAVPFIEEEGRRKFFKLDKDDVTSGRALINIGRPNPRAGESTIRTLEMLQKYVFPPSMDFFHRPNDVDPFAMYVFEFHHDLSKRDLSDIWQNLPPDIGVSFQEAEDSVSHDLFAEELLGGGSIGQTTKLIRDNITGNAVGVVSGQVERFEDAGTRFDAVHGEFLKPIPDRIKWMVFKVKLRAADSYWDLTLGKGMLKQMAQSGLNTEVTYNWPYDFFSLVELAKIDAQVSFTEADPNPEIPETVEEIIETVADTTTTRKVTTKTKPKGPTGIGPIKDKKAARKAKKKTKKKDRKKRLKELHMKALKTQSPLY